MTSERPSAADVRRDLVVLAPLRIEARAIRELGRSLAVTVVGMGRRSGPAAARRARSLAESALAVLAGLGGGVRDGAEAGDVVLASEILDLRGEQGRRARVLCSLPRRETEVLRDALVRRGLRVTVGRLATVGGVAGPRTRALAASQGAEALDMESAPVLDALSPRHLVVARVLLDVPGGELASLGTFGRYRRARRSLVELGGALAQFAAGWSGELGKEERERCRFL